MAKTKKAAPKAKAKASVATKAKQPAPKPKSTRVTTPIATPIVVAPQPPAQRDELPAPRDIGRLLRYGERFGASKIDVRMWSAPAGGAQAQVPTLPAPSGSLALCDPSAPKSWRELDRLAGTGHFRIMLSIARADAGGERLAAVVIHTGRPPISRWTVAHFKGQKKPKSPDALPAIAVTSGWLVLVDAGAGSPGVIATPTAPPAGAPIAPVEIPLTDGRRALALPCASGEYTAYWAVDAADKPICLVVDFGAFTQREWKAKPAA